MSTLPDGWRLAPLMETIDLHDNRRIPLNQRERAERQGPFPYYGANGQVDSINDHIFDGDFILVAEDGGYFDNPARGVAYEVSGKFWVNNHAHILSPKDGIPRRYLTYVLNQLNWMPYVGGSTRLKLTQEGMRKIRIPLAPPGEREQIVAKLDSLFARSKNACEELVRIPRLVERYKQSFLTTMFSSIDFEERAFGDLIAVSPQNGLYLPKSSYGSGTPILRIENYGFEQARPITEWKRVKVPTDQRGRYDLAVNDIIVNRVNSPSHLGKSMVVTRDHIPAVFESNMMRIQLSGEVLPEFIQQFLASDYGRERLTKNAKWAVNQASINQQDVRDTPIPVPPTRIQRKLLQRVRNMQKSLNAVLKQGNSATHMIERLNQAALAKAFRGELVGTQQTMNKMAKVSN